MLLVLVAKKVRVLSATGREGLGVAGRDRGHRRFGNIRKLPSGRFQIRYPGPDGILRKGETTYATKTDADRALTLIEAQMISGEWTDPERGKILLGDYARAWIKERPGLRPKTVEGYTWLLNRHIMPGLGGVALGKITTQMIRSWRADLIANGVSVSVCAKAYRLLRAVLMTATEEDGIVSRNPAKIKGADNEHTAERPILTVSQVFELADRMGRSPVGNIRTLKGGGYQLRFRRGESTHPHPQIFATRAAAEQALWTLEANGQADSVHDRRFHALILLATFASLRWGEVTALRRSDLDLKGRTVRVREQLLELGGGRMILGPVKSRAGRRTVSIPSAIVPALVEHLRDFVGQGDDAFVFLGKRGGFLRGGNFRREARWSEALAAMGLQGFHFHDLRHTGNTLAAQSGTSLADLKARMGHDSDRAALIYQHATRGADQKIANALDARVAEERGDDGDCAGGALVPAG